MPTILLVQSDGARAESIGAPLRAAGFAVEVVDGAPAAVAAAGRRPPDLVIVNSTDAPLTPDLRKAVPAPFLPVLCLRAAADSEPEEADDVLLWPEEASRLLPRVRCLLRLRACGGELGDEVERLVRMGLSLTAELDPDRILERVLDEARALCRADAGTVYTLDRAAGVLRFHVVRNDTLGVRSGPDGRLRLPPVPLSHASVSGHAALSGETVNIPDLYTAEGFDFTGPRQYDALTGYRSRSMLVVPIVSHEREVVAVLQLINSMEPGSPEPVPFSLRSVEQTRALAAQAGIALANAQLVRDLQALLDGLMNVLATTIDEKSPYTAGHVRRVTELSLRLAEAVNECAEPPFGRGRFTPAEINELRVAGLLHDIGKLAIPDHLTDKATKLQGVRDRIEEIRLRFSLIRRSLEVEALNRKLSLVMAGASTSTLADVERGFQEAVWGLEADFDFLAAVNRGGEFMTPDRLERLHAIAARTYVDERGEEQQYLTPDEVRNLSVQRGTLLPEELAVIRTHAAVSARILNRIPFGVGLKRVPEIAGDHHEALDGSGYPRGKRGEQISIQARILAIADIFDALTAVDRPYKKAYPVPVAFQILRDEAERGRLDPRLVELFIRANCPAALEKTAPEAPATGWPAPKVAVAAHGTPGGAF